MATTEERVVLTAELKDQASTPLSKLEAKVDKAAKTVSKASKGIGKSTKAASVDTVQNLLAVGSSATKMQKLAAGGMSRVGTAAGQMQRLATGSMRSVGTAASDMTDRLHTGNRAMGGFLGNLKENVRAYNDLRESQSRTTNSLHNFISKAKEAPGALWRATTNAIQGTTAYQMLSTGMRKAADTAKNTLSLLGAAPRTLGRMVASTVQGTAAYSFLVAGAKKAGSAVSSTLSVIGAAPRNVSRMVSNIVQGSSAYQTMVAKLEAAKSKMNSFITRVRQAPNALAQMHRTLRDNSVGYQIMAYNGLRAAAAVARGAALINRGFNASSSALATGLGAVGRGTAYLAKATGLAVRDIVVGTVSAKSRIIESWKSPTAAISTFTGKLGTVTGVTRTVTDMMTTSFRALGDRLGIPALAGKVRGAFSAISPALSGASTVAGKVASGVGAIAGAAGRAGAAISSQINGALSSTVSTATKAAGVIGAVLGGIAIQGGVSRALNIEDAQAKLKGLGHSAESVQKIMDNASASVKGTAFGLGDAASVAAGAVAAGVEPGKNLERTLKLIGDGATIAGMSMGEMGSIWNKVASSDMIQGDVIAQLGDAGIPILQLLAKETGKSATAVKDMASAGEINFATFQNAMEKGMGGAALKSGETFRGAMANTRSALGRIGETMMNPFLTMIKAGFNAAIPIFDAFNGAIKPIFAKLGAWADETGPKLTAWGEKIGAVITVFSGTLMKGSVAPEKMHEAIAKLGDSGVYFKKITEPAQRLKEVFEGLKAALTTGDMSGVMTAFNVPADSPIIGVLTAVRENFDLVKQAIGPLVGLAIAFFSKFAGGLPIIGQFLPVLNPIVGIIGGLLATSPQLREALFGMFQGLVPVIQTLFTALQPILPIIVEAVGSIGNALAGVLPVVGEALGQLLTAVVGLLPAIAPLIGMVAQFAGQLISMLVPVLPPVIQFIGMLVGVVGQLLPVLMPVIGALLKTGMTILSALIPVLPLLMNALNSLLPPVTSLIMSLMNLAIRVITPLMPLITSIAGLIGDILGAAIQVVAPLIEGLAGLIGGLADALGATLGPVIDTISGALGGLADLLGSVIGAVGDFMGSVGSGFMSAVNTVSGALGFSGGGVVGGFAGGGVVQGFASGGVIPGYAPGKDTVPAVLSRGEAVLVPELVKAIGPRNIMALNRAYSGRQSGGGPSAAPMGEALQSMPMLAAAGGAVLSDTPTLSSGFVSPVTELSSSSNTSYSSNTTVVKVAQGAVQIIVQNEGDQLSDTSLEQIKEAVEEIFEDIERKGY